MFTNMKPSLIYNLPKEKVDILANDVKNHYRYNGNTRFVTYVLPSLQIYLRRDIISVLRSLDGTEESFANNENHLTLAKLKGEGGYLF